MKNNSNSKLMLLISIFLMLIMTTLCMSGCGNMAVLDPGNFSFSHIHISDGVEGHCIDIDKWWDDERGIEVRTKEGGGIFCSEGTYQMFESKNTCPYCQ